MVPHILLPDTELVFIEFVKF